MICVYLAGPITKPDPKENALNAIKYADRLLSSGYSPFVPQLSVFWQEHGGGIKGSDNYGTGYETFMRMDFEWISRCDCLLRIPGFSLGADREVKFATELGIPVFNTIDDLFDYYDTKTAEAQCILS